MKDKPPSLAREIAIVSFETDCIMEETIGMFSFIFASEPILNRVNEVERDTLDGICFEVERRGINRYSLNVCETPSQNIAITNTSLVLI